MIDKRRGIPFQNFVAQIEKLVAGDGSNRVTVESPAYVIDKDSKRQREFDVLITSNVGHHVTKIGIECKDTSRKVGSGEVEAFQTKCDRNHIFHKVMVSSAGFTSGAKGKAESLGIKLMELSQADTFDWLDVVKGMAGRRMLDGVEVKLHFAKGTPTLTSKFIVIDESNGNRLVEPMDWLRAINATIPDDEGRDAAEPVELTVVLECDLTAVCEDGSRHKIVGATAPVVLRWEVCVEPFETHKYVGEDGIGYDVVSHDLTVQGVPGKMILTRNAAGQKTTAWIPSAVDGGK
jgi:hypothetical protein